MARGRPRKVIEEAEVEAELPVEVPEEVPALEPEIPEVPPEEPVPEQVLPEEEAPVLEAAPFDEDVIAVKLKGGVVKMGRKVIINGREHVEITDATCSYFVHDNGQGIYEV